MFAWVSKQYILILSSDLHYASTHHGLTNLKLRTPNVPEPAHPHHWGRLDENRLPLGITLYNWCFHGRLDRGSGSRNLHVCCRRQGLAAVKALRYLFVYLSSPSLCDRFHKRPIEIPGVCTLSVQHIFSFSIKDLERKERQASNAARGWVLLRSHTDRPSDAKLEVEARKLQAKLRTESRPWKVCRKFLKTIAFYIWKHKTALSGTSQRQSGLRPAPQSSILWHGQQETLSMSAHQHYTLGWTRLIWAAGFLRQIQQDLELDVLLASCVEVVWLLKRRKEPPSSKWWSEYEISGICFRSAVWVYSVPSCFWHGKEDQKQRKVPVLERPALKGQPPIFVGSGARSKLVPHKSGPRCPILWRAPRELACKEARIMGKQNHQQQRMLPAIKLCTRFGKASDKVGYLEELPKHFCLQHTAWGGIKWAYFHVWLRLWKCCGGPS